MTALQGYYNAGDNKTWRLAYSLQRLCAEVAVRWPDITNLGTKGDSSHAAQGVSSDHNALWLKPGDPLKIVRAVDFGGPYDQLMELRARLYALGAAQFGPLWSFGYLKGPDSKGCAWPIGSGWNNNSGDEGHLHVSVTQTNGYSPVGGTAGYVPAIDSAESWGISDGTDLSSAALGGTQLSEEDDMSAQAEQDIAHIRSLLDDAFGFDGQNATFAAKGQIRDNVHDTLIRVLTSTGNGQTLDSFQGLSMQLQAIARAVSGRADVDEKALAAELGPLLVLSLPDADLPQLAKSVADEIDRRAKARAGVSV